MKLIWGCAASGNEAITPNKRGSSGSRGSILLLTVLVPPSTSPTLPPHENHHPFRSCLEPCMGFFPSKSWILRCPMAGLAENKGGQLQKMTVSEKSRGRGMGLDEAP